MAGAAATPSTALSQAAAMAQGAPTVRSSTGTTFGTFAGMRMVDGSRHILVRDEAGDVRAVPAEGVSRDGGDIVIPWTEAQFRAAATVSPPGVGGGTDAGPNSQGTTVQRGPAGQASQAEQAQNQNEDATRPAVVEQQEAPGTTEPPQ